MSKVGSKMGTPPWEPVHAVREYLGAMSDEAIEARLRAIVRSCDLESLTARRLRTQLRAQDRQLHLPAPAQRVGDERYVRGARLAERPLARTERRR